jgi:hypothetical protein
MYFIIIFDMNKQEKTIITSLRNNIQLLQCCDAFYIADIIIISSNYMIRVMVFNATFNNILAIISWRSVLLVEETGENHRSHNISSDRQWLYR